jgi:hypothetical protein
VAIATTGEVTPAYGLEEHKTATIFVISEGVVNELVTGLHGFRAVASRDDATAYVLAAARPPATVR